MNKKAFTLVEIITAITIFMIVMVSVIQIFWVSSSLINKIDINRQVQENIKNLTEILSKDIRKYWINWAWNEETLDNYTLQTGNWIKLWNNKYYIWQEVWSVITRKIDITNCSDLKNNCFLVKNDWERVSKLTNSWVAFEKLNFTIMWIDKKKLMINFTMRPATKKWISSSMIEKSKFYFQTTISERFVKTN